MADLNLTPLLEIIEEQIREVVRRKGELAPEKDLLDVIYDFRHLKSRDPRDKIYAMLGLAQSQELDMSVMPDYSAPVEDAYRHLNEAIERLYGDLWTQPGI